MILQWFFFQSCVEWLNPTFFSFFSTIFLLKTNIFSYQFEFLIDSGLITDVSKCFKLVYTILLNAGMIVLYELLQSSYSNQMLLLADMETNKNYSTCWLWQCDLRSEGAPLENGWACSSVSGSPPTIKDTRQTNGGVRLLFKCLFFHFSK